MIVVALMFIWLLNRYGREENFGQPFVGCKFKRDPNQTYSHNRKRKKFSDGKYHYFED